MRRSIVSLRSTLVPTTENGIALSTLFRLEGMKNFCCTFFTKQKISGKLWQTRCIAVCLQVWSVFVFNLHRKFSGKTKFSIQAIHSYPFSPSEFTVLVFTGNEMYRIPNRCKKRAIFVHKTRSIWLLFRDNVVRITFQNLQNWFRSTDQSSEIPKCLRQTETDVEA